MHWCNTTVLKVACYKKHVLFGCIGYGFILAVWRPGFVSLLQISEWLLCMVVGSLFPDIDIKSKGQTLLYGLFFIMISGLLLLNNLCGAALLGLAICVPLLVKHRGLFHTAWFLALMFSGITALLIFVCPYTERMRLMHDMFFCIAGVVSHLVLDTVLSNNKRRRRYR